MSDRICGVPWHRVACLGAASYWWVRPTLHVTDSRSQWRWQLALVAVTALALWPVLLGEPVYDDVLNISRNRALRECDLGELIGASYFREHLNYWRPLASVAMALAYAGGMVGLHLLGLAVHAGATLVAFHVARDRFGFGSMTSFGVAVLFAVHPVQVESVAWVSAFAGVLSSLFVLMSLDAALSTRPRRVWWASAWLLAALLSKETAIAALPVIAYVLARERRLRLLAPIGVVAVWVVLRSVVLQSDTSPPSFVTGWLDYVSGCANTFVHHLLVLVLPWQVTPFRQTLDLPSWAAVGVAVAVCVALVYAWRRTGLSIRMALLLIVPAAGLPAVGFDTLGEFPVQDRYLYLAAFGLGIGLAMAVRTRWQVLAVVAVAFGASSFKQCWVWRSQANFVAHGGEVAPNLATVQVMAGDLAIESMRTGDPAALDRARAHYETALAGQQAVVPAVVDERRAAALAGLGWCLVMSADSVFPHDADKGRSWFRQSLDLVETSAAWVGMGVVQAVSKNFAPAESAFRRAIEMDPKNPQAWYNLGYLMVETGKAGEARVCFRQALRFDPSLDAARLELDRLGG